MRTQPVHRTSGRCSNRPRRDDKAGYPGTHPHPEALQCSPPIENQQWLCNLRRMSPMSRWRWTPIAAIIGLNVTILDETVVFLALERDRPPTPLSSSSA